LARSNIGASSAGRIYDRRHRWGVTQHWIAAPTEFLPFHPGERRRAATLPFDRGLAYDGRSPEEVSKPGFPMHQRGPGIKSSQESGFRSFLSRGSTSSESADEQ